MWGSILGRENGLPSFQNVKTVSMAHSAPYSKVTGVISRGIKRQEREDYLHLVMRLQRKLYLSLPSVLLGVKELQDCMEP
jgi:hypothetical protein